MPLPITGYPSVGYSQAYGGVPRVPDPLSTMHETLRGDISAIPSLYGLSTGVSGASAAGARTQYEANLPMYSALAGRASQNIMANLRGEVNPDVIALLRTQGAESGVGFGPDSPASNAAYLRALGLTSTSLQNLGQQQYTAALGATPRGPLFNPATMLTTPSEEQQAQLYANILQGAPIPSSAAAAAEAAARRGIGAGMGAVGGTGASAAMGALRGTPTGGGYGAMPVGLSTGTGLTYGGQTYYGGQTPEDASAAWQRWIAGLPSSGVTGWDTGAQDTYTYSGFSPEDISQFGLTEEDIYGTSPTGGGGLGGAAAGAGAAGDWWNQMYEDYDPFGIMGPSEGTPVGQMVSDYYAPYDYGLTNESGDYYGDYP